MTLPLFEAQVGTVLEYALPIGVAITAALKSFDVLESPWWFLPWLGLFVFEYVFTRYRVGSVAAGILGRLAEVNGSFAGNLDTATQRLLRAPEHRFSEEASKALCVGLLHRVKTYIQLALNVKETARLRVSLAIPERKRNELVAMHVWCYDQPYSDRRWTRIPAGNAGAPEAFRSGSIQIIRDVREVANVENAEQLAYRSVVSLPVKAGGPNGQTLAVVNIDAPGVNFFSETAIELRVIPLVQAPVNTIAMVLAFRHEEAEYEYGN